MKPSPPTKYIQSQLFTINSWKFSMRVPDLKPGLTTCFENKAHNQALFHLSIWCIEVHKVWRNNPSNIFFPSFPYWHLSVPLTWEQMVRKELNASKDPNSFFYEFLAKNHLCIVFFPKYIFICIYMHFSFPTLFPETTGNRENREKLSEKNNSLALEKNTKHNKTSIVDHMENAHWQPCLVFKIL